MNPHTPSLKTRSAGHCPAQEPNTPMPDDSRRSVSRREFLATGTLAASAFSFGVHASFGADATPRFPLIGFTKPFQKFTAEQTAEVVATVGWDGIEIPVRAKGQIEPERAPDELPKFAEALRRQNRDIRLVATDITSMTTPHTEDVLRTMAKLGIRRFRLGHITYTEDK